MKVERPHCGRKGTRINANVRLFSLNKILQIEQPERPAFCIHDRK